MPNFTDRVLTNAYVIFKVIGALQKMVLSYLTLFLNFMMKHIFVSDMALFPLKLNSMKMMHISISDVTRHTLKVFAQVLTCKLHPRNNTKCY